MKIDVQSLRDSFQYGYEVYEPSRLEANTVTDLYHNRQYTDEQLAILGNRGQPAETFNVVKMFARMLVGYYSNIVNRAKALPTTMGDIINASVMNDVLDHLHRINRMDTEGDQIKLSGLLSGLLCCYVEPVDTGKRDRFGRPINRIVVHWVDESELVPDPQSRLDDYSDARFLHRFRWVGEEMLVKLAGKSKVKELTENYEDLGLDWEKQASFNYGTAFTGNYRIADQWLVVHTVVEDDKGDRWSIYWSADTILKKEKITYRETRWPYRVQRLHTSNRPEYYGIFREIIEPQNAINQAVLKIQQMVNTEKVFVEEEAVKDIDKFTEAFNRVNSVVPVMDLDGIQVEKLSREIQDQYMVINNSLDRIQKVLGINDSFLGMAYASDSGRKVKLQQNATIMSLRYVTARIEAFYRALGEDLIGLVKQFYTANQVIRVADEINGERWIELNRPQMMQVGVDPKTGQPVEEPIITPVYDPDTEEPMLDEKGRYIFAPVAEQNTELQFVDFEVDVESVAYNDEDEKTQLLLETMMSGQIGGMLSKINPAGFFRMASLVTRTMRTKYTPEVAEILKNTGDMLAQDQAAQQDAMNAARGGGNPQGTPQSKSLKLPTNTNEGV